MRLKEKAQEERVRKRRRVEEHVATLRTVDDEDAEWLLDDPNDRGAGSQDALSGLSKESREVLSKLGVGGWKGPEAQEEEELLEEGIKVRKPLLLHNGVQIVTLIDLLHLTNTFAAVSVHNRAPPSIVSLVITTILSTRQRVN